MGTTDHNLINRVNRHLPKISTKSDSKSDSNNDIPVGREQLVVHTSSAIDQHLINNQDCFYNYNLESFKVNSKG